LYNYIIFIINVSYSNFIFTEPGRPAMVSADFERAIWAAITVVLPDAKVNF